MRWSRTPLICMVAVAAVVGANVATVGGAPAGEVVQVSEKASRGWANFRAPLLPRRITTNSTLDDSMYVFGIEATSFGYYAYGQSSGIQALLRSSDFTVFTPVELSCCADYRLFSEVIEFDGHVVVAAARDEGDPIEVLASSDGETFDRVGHNFGSNVVFDKYALQNVVFDVIGGDLIATVYGDGDGQVAFRTSDLESWVEFDLPLRSGDESAAIVTDGVSMFVLSSPPFDSSDDPLDEGVWSSTDHGRTFTREADLETSAYGATVVVDGQLIRLPSNDGVEGFSVLEPGAAWATSPRDTDAFGFDFAGFLGPVTDPSGLLYMVIMRNVTSSCGFDSSNPDCIDLNPEAALMVSEDGLTWSDVAGDEAGGYYAFKQQSGVTVGGSGFVAFWSLSGVVGGDSIKVTRWSGPKPLPLEP